MERGIITITENGTVTMPTVPVWMTQQEMSDAFNVFGCDIRRAVHAIYKNMELFESDTMRYIRQDNGISYDVYSLEMVITIAFRLRTKECMAFRRFCHGQADHEQQTACQHFSFRSPHIMAESEQLEKVKRKEPTTGRENKSSVVGFFLL